MTNTIRQAEEEIKEINRKVLKERARILAEKPESKREESLEILRFKLAEEIYAFETNDIREVFNVQEITPLPSTPVFLKGIINVRGEILSVIDIKSFFDLEEKKLTPPYNIVILQKQDKMLGILAEGIDGVFHISKENMQDSLPTLDSSKHRYLKGITRDRIIILDAGAILNDKKLIIDEEI